ncbi:phosphotransferase [Mycolicibacterium confluentis]|nr:phosphotransferase [Mycolicibacterium confluentis]
MRAEQIAEGVGFLSYLYRLHLDLDGTGPATLVAKLPTDTAYLHLAQMTGAYTREVHFYANVAPSAPLRTAHAHVAQIAPESTDFVLVLDDLGGLDAADHLDGLPIDRVERVIDQFAEFHAWAWNLGPEVTRAQVIPAIDDPAMAGLYSMGVALGWATYRTHGRVAAPTGLGEFLDGFAQHLPGLLAALGEPQTLLNGDLRADNLFFDADENPTLVDFQLVMRGAGVWDIAYLVGQGMTPVQRAGRERELVQRYVDALTSHGVRNYGFDDAWRQFQAAVLAQITFPLTAMMSWDTLTDRARELLHALTERAFAIISDTNALQTIGD